MGVRQRPVVFSRWESLWQEWHRWLQEKSLTPVEACLGFVLTHPSIDRVVVGVESVKQLEEILMNSHTRGVEPPMTLVTEAPDLVNPSRWAHL
jgi:aryl-alcohol dehydrogenase-like predicted oxidoreductase